MDSSTRQDASNLSPLWPGLEEAKSEPRYGESAPERLFYSQGVHSISAERCASIVFFAAHGFSSENAYHTQFEQTLVRVSDTMLTAPLPHTETQTPTCTLIFQPRRFDRFARLFVFCSFRHWGKSVERWSSSHGKRLALRLKLSIAHDKSGLLEMIVWLLHLGSL